GWWGEEIVPGLAIGRPQPDAVPQPAHPRTEVPGREVADQVRAEATLIGVLQPEAEQQVLVDPVDVLAVEERRREQVVDVDAAEVDPQRLPRLDADVAEPAALVGVPTARALRET